MQTVEAIIDENGNVYLLKPIHLSASKRALVTILEEEPVKAVSETALLSEQALAQDWMKPEEDQAWSHLSAAQ
jgi:hypothetical protein